MYLIDMIYMHYDDFVNAENYMKNILNTIPLIQIQLDTLYIFCPYGLFINLKEGEIVVTFVLLNLHYLV